MTPIENDEQHAALLKRIEQLMDLDPDLGTPEGDELTELVDIVVAYEEKRWPIDDLLDDSLNDK